LPYVYLSGHSLLGYRDVIELQFQAFMVQQEDDMANHHNLFF